MKTMNKKITHALFAIIIILLANSCKETIKPEDQLQDRLKWTVDFKELAANSLFNYIPAIDELGNIYVTGNANYGTHLIKISPSGEKIWEKNNYSFFSRIIYNNNKLYFVNDKTLICLNSADGSLLWEKENSANGNIIALSQNKIYTTFLIENSNGFFDAFLYAFDLNGNKLWQEEIKHVENIPPNTFCNPYVMSVKDNKIYIGVLAEVENSNFAILEYTDNGNSAQKTWTWQAPEDYSFYGDSKTYYGDLAIDDNGDILFAMFYENNQYVMSVSSSGTLNWSARSSINTRTMNVITDGTGDAFISYDVLEKFNSGNKIWTSALKENWSYGGVQSMGLAISNSKNVSSVNINTILTNVNTDGSKNWEQYSTQIEGAKDEYHNVTINRNGDIIVVSKSGIRCYEGDGSGLSEKGWPKLFGNYANTSGR